MSDIVIKKFFDDFKLQQEYEEKVYKLINTLKNKFSDFDIVLHGNMIKQISRSEIQVFKYEKKVANDKENKIIMQLLANERTHLRQLYDKMMTTLSSIRGDKNTLKMEIPTNFVKFLNIELAKGLDTEKGEGSSEGRGTNN